ncbi:hypothetical protein CRE_03792 [Caenorhabditis remanei]|uniref:CCHC-type domain-containing protein n=1 Tax=Caenorhabditis remanei TaxID=31234 RepID=E3LYB2_CAERE|nr:hypothetical protein CRE_03792 [Caenorhabditis remanei]
MSFSTERTKKRSSSVTSSEKSWAVQMNEVRLKERRKLVKGFTDFLESSGRMESDMYEALKAACKGNERQSEVLVEPVKKYCQELRERFEELGGERWPLEIIGVMRENGVETVEELRELCEKGVEMVPGGIVENANKAQDELALLQDAWNEERETLFRELNKLKEEKRLAEEAVSKYKKTLKEEREASSELRGLLRKQESEPKKAGQARDTKEVPVPSRLEVVRKWSPRDSDDEFSMHGRRGEFSDSERSWGEDWKSGRSSRYSAENEVMMGMVASMGRMMKASALPEPKTFDGTGDFKEFKRAFLLKYQQVTDEDNELVAILEERYLKGAAKSLFKSLGDRQERPIAELFVEFERKLRKRQGDAKAEALHEFDRLQRAPGQKLWEYLVEVEKWSKKAYPEVEKATLSQMRTTKLMRATEDDDMLQSVLVAKRLELPLAAQYDQLKDIVLQRENEKLRKQKERMGRLGDQGNSDGRRSPEGSNDGDRKTVGERRDSGAKMKCFTCGGVGHGSWQCVSKRVDKVQIQEGTVKNAGVETVEMVEMLGQRRRVVIDSGAVVSVISTSAYERLKAGCRDWEKEVEVFGKPTFTILNASNSKMRVRGQIKIPMVVRGRKVRVVFQLVENWVEKILIGTNAFESIGVELKWKDPYGLVNAEENSAEVQFIGGEKKLERPGEKLRKVPTEVSEIQCKSVAVRGERGRSASTGDVGEVFKSEGEKERKKVKIRASVAVIGPRLEARGPGVLEYRNKTITGWTQKFDWGEVKEAVVLVEYTDKEDENSERVEFVKSVAKEVEKVWMMPRSLQCEFGDVAKVTEKWKIWMEKSVNVEVVDPLMPVGKHKIPLILEKWNQKSLDGLRQYLRMALPNNSTGCQLKKDETLGQDTTIWIGESLRKRTPDRREEGEVASPRFFSHETHWKRRNQRREGTWNPDDPSHVKRSNMNSS